MFPDSQFFCEDLLRILSEKKKGNKNHLGHKHSEETKKKWSEDRKGKNHIFYGKHLSEEHRKRISESLRGEKNPMYGKHHTKEWKEKVSKKLKGIPRPEEVKRKISEGRKGKYSGKDSPMYGKHHSEETKQKLREKAIGREFSEEWKENISKGKKKFHKEHPDAQTGERNPMYGKHHTDEWKRNHSEMESGDKHWNWRGGVSFEPYGIEFNERLKRRIKERDNHQCQLCHNEGVVLDVHHVDYCKTNNLELNLITICHSCHTKTSNSNRQYWRVKLQKIIKGMKIKTKI